MFAKIAAPRRRIPLEQLTPQSFAPFGAVIDNPNNSGGRPGIERVIANQGTCQRWFDITHLTDFYHLAQSGRRSKPSMSFAICEPRKTGKSEGEEVYQVEILERHPFTSQTFIPVGLAPDDKSTAYVVIVAPTLPDPNLRTREELKGGGHPYPPPDPSSKESKVDVYTRNRAAPYTNEKQPPRASVGSEADDTKPKGPGLPDLHNIRAFLAHGNQAVTYGAGTWHAPMAVIGKNPIEFVIVQNVNGVGDEDCQEAELLADAAGGEGLQVTLGKGMSLIEWVKAKL